MRDKVSLSAAHQIILLQRSFVVLDMIGRLIVSISVMQLQCCTNVFSHLT